MANAKIDQNGVRTLLGVSSADGTTIDRIKVIAATHALHVSDGSTGSDFGTLNAKRDENSAPCLMGVSSVDGVTPVAIYTDGSGALLTQST